MTSPYDQHDYRLRLEWGGEGVAELAGDCAVLVVIDVLSFSTSVSIAVDRGAAVLPLRSRDEEAARAADAVLASPRRGEGWSLSPSTLTGLPSGTRLALPSPNGATLSAAAAGTGCRVFAGCLRNATAVAEAMATAVAGAAVDGAVAVVPAGERWRVPGSPLRPALEDLIGAGAIASALVDGGFGPVSPEALAAVQVFRAARDAGLRTTLAGCSSGRELIADGFESDVDLAAAHDVSANAPALRDGLFQPDYRAEPAGRPT